MLALLVAIAAAGLAGAALRRWLLPGAEPAIAMLGTAVGGVSATLVVAQLVGLVGAFRVGPVVAGLIAVAGASHLAGSRWSAATVSWTAREDTEPRWLRAAVVGTVGAATVQWAVAVVPTIRAGIADIDGIHYHLPHAAGYARTGRILPLQVLETAHPSAYYPSNDEVLRAIGLQATGSDLPLVLVNIAAAALLLVAAHVVGRHWGRPWSAVAGAAALLAGPVYGPVYAGWAHVDWTAVAFMVVAIALLVTTDGHRGGTILAGAALGIAAGTKLPVTPAVAIVAIVAVVLARDRTKEAARLVVPAVVVGGWWYVRNLAVIGTPFPGLPGFGGPPALLADGDQSVAHYLGDLAVIGEWFLPGLRLFYGYAWPLLMVAVVFAVVSASRRAGWPRGLAVIATLAAAAYLVLPTTALGPEGSPVLFVANLRYLWPALTVAMLTLATTRRSWPVVAVLVVAWVGLAEARAWAADPTVARLLAAAVAVTAAAMAARYRPGIRMLRLAAVAATVVAVAITTVGPVANSFERSRYRDRFPGQITPYVPLFRATADVVDTTVAVSGYPLVYPFLGPDRSNRLVVPHQVRQDGALVPHSSCALYRQDLAANDVEMVVVLLGGPDPGPPELLWAATDPAATIVASAPRGIVVRLTDPADPAACPAGPMTERAATQERAAAYREVLRLPTAQVRDGLLDRLPGTSS